MQVHIVPEALPAGALQCLQTDANALAECSNFWVAKVAILDFKLMDKDTAN